MNIPRKGFLAYAGALSLAGCGASAISIPGLIPTSSDNSLGASRVTYSRCKSGFRFDTGLHTFENVLNPDLSVSILYNGAELTRHSITDKGAFKASARSGETNLVIPKQYRPSVWYTTPDQQLYHRFDEKRQRYEATDFKRFSCALGESQRGGLNFGTAINHGAKATLFLGNGIIGAIAKECEDIVSQLHTKPPTPESTFRIRVAEFESAAQRLKAPPSTGLSTMGAVVRCWTTSIESLGGTVIASRTECDEEFYNTYYNTSSYFTINWDNGQTNNSILNCILASVAAWGAAGTTAQVINALIAAYEANPTSFSTTAALVAVLTGSLLAALGAATLILLAAAAVNAYKSC